MTRSRALARPPMQGSIVICTRNRRAELRRALLSCVRQEPPVEILVLDDGSVDGTPDMVQSEFPQVRLHRSIEPQGCIRLRNLAATLVSGDVILSLDDDAEYSSPEVVRRTLGAFSHAKVGAVTVPWRNEPYERNFRDQAPDNDTIYLCRTYTGVAHAVRRDVFIELGGYREFYEFASEELDFCIRLLEAGLLVRLGYSGHVSHYQSRVRNRPRETFLRARNAVLFGWYHAPLPWLPVHAVGVVCNTVRYAITKPGCGLRLRGMAAGFGCWFTQWRARRPVSMKTYRLFRKITRQGCLPLADVVKLIAPARWGPTP